MIEVTSHGKKFQFEAKDWSSEFQTYLLAYALKVILDRSSASLTKKDGNSDKDRLEACEKVAERLTYGQLPARGGASRTRMSDEDWALKQVLNTLIKPKKGEDVDYMLFRYTCAVAEAKGKEYEPEMNDKVKAKLETTELYKSSLAARKANSKPTPNIMDGLDL